MIVPLFSRGPKRNFPDEEHGVPFKPNAETTEMIVGTSVRDTSRLLLRFTLHNMHRAYMTRSDFYICYLLQQTSPGSIHALLKEKGWGLEITCESNEGYFAFFQLDVTLRLTPQGRKNVGTIVDIVLQQIERIKREGITQRLFQEVRQAATPSNVRW